jgi:hypothetical protein
MYRLARRMMFELSGPVSPLSGVMRITSACLISREASSGKVVSASRSAWSDARSPITARNRSAYGRLASTRCWARRILDADTISIARVI